MNNIQQSIVILYGLVSFIALVKGVYEVRFNHNRHGLTPFGLLGIFVWTDAVIIGIFWVLASIFVFIVNSWSIGLLVVSLFWIVRSLGEVLYWMLQQFASKKLDKPEDVPWHSWFPGQSVYIAQQIWWQMVLVVSLLSMILIVKSL